MSKLFEIFKCLKCFKYLKQQPPKTLFMHHFNGRDLKQLSHIGDDSVINSRRLYSLAFSQLAEFRIKN